MNNQFDKIYLCRSEEEYEFIKNYLHIKDFRWGSGHSLTSNLSLGSQYRVGESEVLLQHPDGDIYRSGLDEFMGDRRFNPSMENIIEAHTMMNPLRTIKRKESPTLPPI